MTKSGKLVTIATGTSVDVFGYATDKDQNDKFVEKLCDETWNLHSTIFIENFSLFDCRMSASKVNKLFCYKVWQALKGGSNIFIVVPDAKMVDLRLRSMATILSIPDGSLTTKIPMED